MSFFARIGGALVRPRGALAEAVAERGDGHRKDERANRAAADLAILIALRVLASAPAARLIASAAALPEAGTPAVLAALMQSVREALPDAVAILCASILLSFLVPRGARGREMAVAAYGWVPYLAVTGAGALWQTVTRPLPAPGQTAIVAIGLGWSFAVWTIGWVEMRRLGS